MTRTYRAARLFDGHDLRPGPVDVTVHEGRIATVTDAGAGPCDVDLGDATVLPGLLDAHVHLTWSGGTAPEREVAADHPSVTALRTARHAVDHLRAGVTTVRDVGSGAGHAIAIGHAVESGLLRGPRVLPAGHAIAMTGGHVWGHISREADGADGLRRAVRTEIRDGARCIKLMASGGILGEPTEQPGAVELVPDELVAAVVEAHKLHRTVAAHAHSGEAIRNAVEAGVDSVEHGSMLDARTADLLAERGTVLVPTVSAIRALAANAERLGVPAHIAARAHAAVEHWHDALRHAVAAGVTIAAGTDAGVPGQPHGRVADEVAALVEAGLDPVLALRATTSVAADLLGLGDVAGRIAPGRVADLVVVRGDPTRDVTTLATPQHVLLAGTPVDDPADAPLG